MNARFVRRAVGRQVRKPSTGVAVSQPKAAATPAPRPSEPESPLVLPLPKVQPAETESEPEAPLPPATSHLEDFYLPFNPEERVFVAELAVCRVNLARRRRILHSIESAIQRKQPNPANWSKQDLSRLVLAASYCEQAEKSHERAQANIDSFMEQRTEDMRWVTDHELAAERFEYQKKKAAARAAAGDSTH